MGVISWILNLIGEYFGEDLPEDEFRDPIDFNPGVAVDIGYTWIRIFKQLIIPSYARYSELKKGPNRCNVNKATAIGFDCGDYDTCDYVCKKKP